MRKVLATTIAAAAIMGITAPAAEAKSAPTVRTIVAVDACEFEDGSGSLDSWRNVGCVFYGSDRALHLNFDGGRRSVRIPGKGRKGSVPLVTEGMPLRVTFNTKTRQVLSVRHASGRWSATGGKVQVWW